MFKVQNNEMPILESVKTLNSYGMEVVSGMIMGLDTDTYETPDRILEFVEASKIPVLTINLLEALPRTPLHRRLQAEGRLIEEEGRAVERGLQAAVRRCRRHVAAHVFDRVRAGGDLPPLRVQPGAHVSQPRRDSAERQAERGERVARREHAGAS